MERPIGVIDSGVGGLTVAHELMRQLPREQLIYLGDNKRCPYGPRTKDEVRKFTWEMVNFLLKKNIKLLVIACNTATAFTIDELTEHLEIPIIGVINPGARAAINATVNEQIGVIGTEGTIKSEAYPAALKKINPNLQVEAAACPLFVPIVEKGVLAGDEVKEVVKDSLLPFENNKEMDTLILGCTHYPLLKPVIQEVIGEHVTVISSSEETARETSAVLELKHLQTKRKNPPVHEFYSTGNMDIFYKIAETIFKESKYNNSYEIKSAVIDVD
ncbi:glutamate racemase [Oceanobacillus sp. FSL H7-0719]|uniref:glutamate racemase n=1 Tax=Oceanobacillus sp. FSL H7-0719 TaxID=2954507 RepID=UPI003254BC0A